MKPESLKHLQKMHGMCSDNGTITNVGNLIRMKETIEAIIRIESEPKTKSKFKIWDYVSDDAIRPAMCHVCHDGGFKVASNGHVLVAVKEDYDPSLEGRLMLKNGTLAPENEYRYPRWRDVIPNTELMEMVSVKIDFDKLKGFEADFKAKKKLDKRMEGYVRVGGCLFKLEYLIKAIRFMEHVGTDEFMVSPDSRRAGLAVSGDSKMILMPVYPREKFEDNEVCYGL